MSFVTSLTTTQIAALSTTSLNNLSTTDIASLASTQVQALTTTQLNALGSTNLGAFSTAQVAKLTTTQVAALTSTQLNLMQTSDVAALTTTQVSTLTSTQLNGLDSTHLGALSTAQVAGLSSTQLNALSTTNLGALTTTQVSGLSTTQAANLSSTQLNALQTSDIAALSTAAVASLSSTQLNALTSTNLQALETTDIAALTSTQVGAMTTTQLSSLTMAQVDSLTGTQSLNAAQVVALLSVATPLVLDLNGDGVHTRGIGAGVKFDLDATGHASNVGWVSAQDGFLTLDRNDDGKVNDGSELFGSATVLSTGTMAQDGFQALRDLDTNGDGLINASDAQFADLKVWTDTNQDGVSETTELHTLTDVGITQISLDAHHISVMDQGNWIGLESTFTTADGHIHALADVWLQINQGQNQNIDLTAVNAGKLPLEGMPKIDLSGNGGHGDTVTLDVRAVEKLGQVDLVVNDQTGHGHIQMMIQGDANDTVNIVDAKQWHDAGTTVVDGQDYHLLNDGNMQLLVGVKLHHDPAG